MFYLFLTPRCGNKSHTRSIHQHESCWEMKVASLTCCITRNSKQGKKWERTVVVAKISYELNGRWWCFCSTEWAKIKTLLGKVGERTLAMLMFVRFLCVHAGNFLMLKAKQSWKRGIGQSRVNCVEFASEVCNARWNLFRMFNLFCKVKTKLFDFKFYSTSKN